MKKSDRTIIILLSLLFLIPILYYSIRSLIPKDPKTVAVIEQTISNIQKGNPPTSSELKVLYDTLPPEDYQLIRGEIYELVEHTSYEEIVEKVSVEIKKGIEQQTILKIDHYTLEFTQDTLTLKDSINEKFYDNIHAVLNIYVDKENLKENDPEPLMKFSDVAYESMNSTIYGSNKVNGIKVYLYDLKGDLIDQTNSSKYTINAIMKINPPKEEMTAQTIAFDFVGQIDTAFGTKTLNQNKNSILRQFGFKPESNELWIEIALYAIEDQSDAPLIDAGMKKVAKMLVDDLLVNSESQTYLKNNKGKQITVSFYTPWQKDVTNLNHAFTFPIPE